MIDRFDNAFGEVRASMVALAEAENHLIEAERLLAVARNAALLRYEAKDLGTNEERRPAKLAELTERERGLVREATDNRNAARLQMELARLELDGVKFTLRVLEANANFVNAHIGRYATGEEATECPRTLRQPSVRPATPVVVQERCECGNPPVVSGTWCHQCDPFANE